MTSYVALLRAVNVGGTGKLPMSKFKALCQDAGFAEVRTYIASGNILFDSGESEAKVRSKLEAKLKAHAGKPVGVIVRTAAEIAGVVKRNPFAKQPGNRVMVLFTDDKPPADPLKDARGTKDEELKSGKRELFIFYPNGQGKSRLSLPSMKSGTARNMNTVAKLAAMAKAEG
jgi:uncharacterized protein (DUF1697 family)